MFGRKKVKCASPCQMWGGWSPTHGGGGVIRPCAQHHKTFNNMIRQIPRILTVRRYCISVLNTYRMQLETPTYSFFIQRYTSICVLHRRLATPVSHWCGAYTISCQFVEPVPCFKHGHVHLVPKNDTHVILYNFKSTAMKFSTWYPDDAYIICHLTLVMFLLSTLPDITQQELSYRTQIARHVRTQYVEGIYRPKYYTVTLKTRSRVTQGHWKQNHWIDHTRLTISRVIWRWILS